VQLTLFSSSFCGSCTATRSVLSRAARLIPDARLVEKDVVRFETDAEAAGIRSTPTVVVTDASGVEVFRAEGVPTLNQVLVAAAKAI
jgi:hypothetical protein